MGKKVGMPFSFSPLVEKGIELWVIPTLASSTASLYLQDRAQLVDLYPPDLGRQGLNLRSQNVLVSPVHLVINR